MLKNDDLNPKVIFAERQDNPVGNTREQEYSVNELSH